MSEIKQQMETVKEEREGKRYGGKGREGKKKVLGKGNIDGRVQKEAMDRKEEEGCNFDDRKAR